MQRGDHVLDGQSPRRDLAGIEPDAHRIVARAENLDVAHAVHARQRILDVRVA